MLLLILKYREFSFYYLQGRLLTAWAAALATQMEADVE